MQLIDDPQKKSSQISLIALAALVAAAIYYYKERLFFLDSAYIVFDIINQKKLVIQEGRYGSFITQLPPYIGQLLHLPVAVILVSYTLSFNIFYLAIAAALHRMRQYGLTIVMALYYFLLVSASFFWTNNELHQAIAWTFLFLGVTLHLGARRVSKLVLLPVFVVLGGLAISTHYIVVIPLFFFMGLPDNRKKQMAVS